MRSGKADTGIGDERIDKLRWRQRYRKGHFKLWPPYEVVEEKLFVDSQLQIKVWLTKDQPPLKSLGIMFELLIQDRHGRRKV